MITGSLHLPHDAAVDAGVVGWRCGSAGERAARHDHEPAAHRLDRLDLLFVSADDLVDGRAAGRVEMIGADAAADFRAAAGS